MVQLLRISEETSLEGLERDFQLQRNDDHDFFGEWRQELVNLSQGDRDVLKRITEFYKNISRRSVVSENIVKMAILSPLLDLAGFYSSQFAIADEESITISAIDGETVDRVDRGRIDILVIQQSLWILVIESKSSSFSLHKALPQALAYMLASPNSAKTTLGLITNGSEYRFIKLDATGNAPIYATSSLFSIFPPDDDLPTVLQILRRLAQIIAP